MGRPAMPEEFKAKAKYTKIPPTLREFVSELAKEEGRSYADAINECIRFTKKHYQPINRGHAS